MPWFNGVQIQGEDVVLLKTNHSYELGANMLMVREAGWLLKQQPEKQLDIVFSYNMQSIDEEKATIVPHYLPIELAQTNLGKITRNADDNLKLYLIEVCCVKYGQIALDLFTQSKQGDVVSLLFKGGVSRMRLKTAQVVGYKTDDRFIIKDVELIIEYDSIDNCQNTCEQLYLTKLKDLIVKKAKKTNHIFYQLKQVIVAQALVNFISEKHKKLPFPYYKPNILIYEVCGAILFKRQEHRMIIWQTLSAAFITFENAFKHKDANIFIEKTSASYDVHIIKNALDKVLIIAQMNFFGQMITYEPTCPDGGILLHKNVPWHFMDTNKNKALFQTVITNAKPYNVEEKSKMFPIHTTTDVMNALGSIGNAMESKKLWRGDTRFEDVFKFGFTSWGKNTSEKMLEKHKNIVSKKSGFISTSTSFKIATQFSRQNIVSPEGMIQEVSQKGYVYEIITSKLPIKGNKSELERIFKRTIPTTDIKGAWEMEGNKKMQYHKNPNFVKTPIVLLQSTLKYTSVGSMVITGIDDFITIVNQIEISNATNDYTNTAKETTKIVAKWIASLKGSAQGGIFATNKCAQFPICYANPYARVFATASGIFVGGYLGHEFSDQAMQLLYDDIQEQILNHEFSALERYMLSK